MKLMTKQLKHKIPPLYATEKTEDPIVHCKLFTPDSSFSWFIIEYDGEDICFGKVFSHLCPEGELGYFSLLELQTVKGPLGLPVERDLYFEVKPLSQCK